MPAIEINITQSAQKPAAGRTRNHRLFPGVIKTRGFIIHQQGFSGCSSWQFSEQSRKDICFYHNAARRALVHFRSVKQFPFKGVHTFGAFKQNSPSFPNYPDTECRISDNLHPALFSDHPGVTYPIMQGSFLLVKSGHDIANQKDCAAQNFCKIPPKSSDITYLAAVSSDDLYLTGNFSCIVAPYLPMNHVV